MDLSNRTLVSYSRNPPSIAFEAAKAGLRPEVYEALKRAQEVLPFAIRVTSTARPGGRSTSQHFTGNAADIGLRGLDDAQRTMLVRALINEGGFNRIGAYSGNTGLHVDMAPQRLDNGAPWPMFDKSRANMARAPAWFTQGLAGYRAGGAPAAPVAPVALAAPAAPAAPAPANPTPDGRRPPPSPIVNTRTKAPAEAMSPASTALADLAGMLAGRSGAALGPGAGMGLASILSGGMGAAPAPALAPALFLVPPMSAPIPEMPSPVQQTQEFVAVTPPAGAEMAAPVMEPAPVAAPRIIGRPGYRRGTT